MIFRALDNKNLVFAFLLLGKSPTVLHTMFSSQKEKGSCFIHTISRLLHRFEMYTDSFTHRFSPQTPAKPMLGQEKARSQEVHLGPASEWQEPRSLSHQLQQSRHISGKLHCKYRVTKTQTRYSNMGYNYLKQQLNFLCHNTHPHTHSL